MPTVIRTFPDGSHLEFDRGSFDDWCVYLVSPDGTRNAPTDVEYFIELAQLGARHPSLYNDFLIVFERTSKSLDQALLHDIRVLSEKYRDDAQTTEKLLTILYASMVAEENKANTKLGKKVKRLGVHQVLVEKMKPAEAATFSKGMTWQNILREYEKRVPR